MKLAAAVLGVAAYLYAVASFAAATIQSMRGEVRAGPSSQVLMSARENQQLAAGTTVTTGPDSQAVLQFDDGQRVVLGQNTEFRIVDFRYVVSQPAADRNILDLLRGAARFVTGAIGQRKRDAISIRTPQATIGIRGTDFMLAIVNPLYLSVTTGAVSVNTAAGTAAFGAGALGSVTGPTALAATIPASALPAAASAAFANLSSVVISAVGAGGVGVAGGAATGAAVTGSAAVGGVGVGTMIGIGAAVAVGAAAASGGSKSTPTHSQ